MLHKFTTAYRLGLANILRVLIYRSQLQSGEIKNATPSGGSLPTLDLKISSATVDGLSAAVSEYCDRLSAGELQYYGNRWYRFEGDDRWLRGPRNGDGVVAQARQHWTEIDELSSDLDIKHVWEASRFGWLLPLAVASRANEQSDYWDSGMRMVADWASQNPINVGPNWRCAQETSIRMLHLVYAAGLASGWCDSTKMDNNLYQWVITHCSRIEPTIEYAIAQDNNHAVSEAVALTVGGWFGWKSRNVNGQDLLADSLHKLVDVDGCFSQVSTTYHRMVIDLLTMLRVLQLWLCPQQPLLQEIVNAHQRLMEWLDEHIPPDTRDAPNLGPNDGAHVGNFLMVSYRDFRSSFELGKLVWSGVPIDKESPVFLANCILPTYQPINLAGEPRQLATTKLNKVPSIRNEFWYASMRAPIAEFRPAQADFMHVDLWHEGRNVLRDSGTYSYRDLANSEPLRDSCGHNTVEFGGRGPMRRIGQFLFADWPNGTVTRTLECIKCSMHDYRGNTHTRSVYFEDKTLVITDCIVSSEAAILRWHLGTCENWTRTTDGVASNRYIISIAAYNSDNVRRDSQISIERAFHSNYYDDKVEHQCVVVDLSNSSRVTTTILAI